jgi:uncharacterized protein (UPF0332 family)
MAGQRLTPEVEVYLEKARQNVQVAASALAASQFNACASRAYYAAFQAAVAALWVEGIRPPRDQGGTLSHQVVQAEWSGRLIYRRKRYPPEMRTTLQLLYEWRLLADYSAKHVVRRDAEHALRLSSRLVEAVETQLASGPRSGTSEKEDGTSRRTSS